MIRNSNSYSSLDQRIDSIRVSDADRETAKEHLRDAEFVAELICRAVESARGAEELVGRLFAHRAG